MKHIIYTDFTQKKDSVVSDFDQRLELENIYNKTKTENGDKVLREIKRKFSAYKSQDKIKHKYDHEHHITLDELIEKLHQSNLHCYYCNCDLVIIYNKRKEGTQWTLERLDNNLGHYASNTCISCLKCNLQRRTDNYEYFKRGKMMQVVKTD